MSTQGLSLYHYGSCPFCVRVRVAADRLGLDIELRDIQLDRERLRELVEATGRQTVPCLRVEAESGDAEWMHESTEIVRYLEERFAS